MDREITAREIIGRKASDSEIHSQGFKTFCTCAVLGFYGIDKSSFKYCQWVSDMIRHLNKIGLSAKARHTRKGITGRCVHSLPKLVEPGYYLVQTHGHVCLAYVGNKGKLSFPVETNPIKGKRNYRKILTLHKIINKK